MIFISAGIYKITSPSGKVYIGQSLNIRKRWNFYRTSKAKSHPKLYNSFCKYGVDNHYFEIIHELPLDISQNIINYYEQLYMDSYRKCGIELLNIREGGYNGRHSKETIEKLRVINTGKILNEETKIKIGLKSKGNKYRLGTKHTKETIEKKSKKVLQFDKFNNFINEFIGAKEAEKLLNISQSNISEVCRGKRKSAGGYIWKFKL